MNLGSTSVLTPSIEEVNLQNHRHFGTGALWTRQAELAEHVLADLDEDFWGGGVAPYDDDDPQDLYCGGIQDQAVLHEVDED